MSASELQRVRECALCERAIVGGEISICSDCSSTKTPGHTPSRILAALDIACAGVPMYVTAIFVLTYAALIDIGPLGILAIAIMVGTYALPLFLSVLAGTACLVGGVQMFRNPRRGVLAILGTSAMSLLMFGSLSAGIIDGMWQPPLAIAGLLLAALALLTALSIRDARRTPRRAELL